MGTGKSTVAPLVAEALSRPFVDTDALIVTQAGMSISQIFATHGEAWFRRLEAEICVDCAARGGQVIATGGGALLNRDTLAAMTATGMVVCLKASVEVLAERLADDTERPLVVDWQARLAQRQPFYDVIPYQVDTSALSPQQIAEEIIQRWHTYFK